MKKFAWLLTAILALIVSSGRCELPEDETLAFDRAIQGIESAVANKTKDKKTINGLIQAVTDETADVRIRERAAWALGLLRVKTAETPLITAAAHKSLLIRSAALNSLIQLRSKAALPIFMESAERDAILSLRQRATIALGLLRAEKSIPVLVTLSEDPREEIRGAAALAFGAVHSAKNSAIDLLKEMKGDSSSYVQERAGRALEAIQGTPDQLSDQLASVDSDIRLFAALHYGLKGKSSDLAVLKPLADSDAEADVRQELASSIHLIQKRIAAQARAKKAAAQARAKKAAAAAAKKKEVQRQ